MNFEWFVDFLGSAAAAAFGAAVIAGLGILFRDTIARYFSRGIEHRFDEKLEDIKAAYRQREIQISAELAAKGNELNQIATFLSASKRERDSVIQAKRMLAAEAALTDVFRLAKQTMTVEMVKLIKYDKFSEWAQEHPEELDRFLKMLKIPEAISEYSQEDQTLMTLYLPESALKNYSALRLITMSALMKMSVAGLDLKSAIASDVLRKAIVELVPSSEEGFNKYGDEYGYYWRQYFYDKTVELLRETATGVEQGRLDTVAAADIAASTERARALAASQLAGFGVPGQVLHSAAEMEKLDSERKDQAPED